MDGFVLKLNPTATAVIYSTLVPGAGLYTAAVAVDSSGNAYFTGNVEGSDNSITATQGVVQASHNGITNPVVVKFGPTGALQYATFLGNSGQNNAGGIAVDGSGNAYISGQSDSASFPVTPGAYAGAPNDILSAFVVKLNPQASGFVYSTFLGPADPVGRIRIDAQGNAYVLGVPGSVFPTTPTAFQSTLSSVWNPSFNVELVFIAKLNSTGSNLIFSSLFDSASRFDVDPAGNVYLAGVAAAGFPVTQGAFQRCVAGPSTAIFTAQLNPSGQLAAASYIGGNGYDYPTGIAVGPGGSVYLATTVSSPDFPGLPNTPPPTLDLTVTNLLISNPNNPDLPCLTEAIQNGASFEPLPIAPGELVTLRGVDLGPTTPAVAQTSASGQVSDQLAGTQVLFNGIPAPVLYAQSAQINAQVPWELAGVTTAQVQVVYRDSFSNTATISVQNAAPALFHIISPSSLNPLFQGAILNQDGTVNSPSNPAAQGSVVSVFGTGGGVVSPGGITGGVAPLNPLGFLTLPVYVQIGGYLADVLYAGTAPTLISGVFQLNVRVPSEVTPGSNIISISIGGYSTAPPGTGSVMISVQ